MLYTYVLILVLNSNYQRVTSIQFVNKANCEAVAAELNKDVLVHTATCYPN